MDVTKKKLMAKRKNDTKSTFSESKTGRYNHSKSFPNNEKQLLPLKMRDQSQIFRNAITNNPLREIKIRQENVELVRSCDEKP